MPNENDAPIDLGDLTPVEISYKIGGKPYLLREASSAAAAKYRNAAVSGAKIEDGKMAGFGNIGELEPLLVSLCLFAVTDGGTSPAPVPLSTVKSWPAKVVTKLFDKAKEISGLDEKEKESDPGKAAPPATDSTSD